MCGFRPVPGSAPLSPRGDQGLDNLGQNEHCQRLSITMPMDARPDERLPVMVWIHGGSYVTGAGDSPLTDPARLVAEQRVVAVTVTYRLGLFGYLGDNDRPANLGLLDQQEAFRWVRRNIAAFSGDPDNITAFGESAGADAVVHLMASANGEHLFRRDIIQSAPLGIRTGRQRMTAAMTRGARNLAADMSAAEILTHQQHVLRASARFGLRGGMPFAVQYGQPPLPPEDQVENALDKAADIPVLIGTNTDETSFFTSTVPPIAALSRWPLVGQALAQAIIRRTTASVYGAATDQFARRHAQAGGTAHRYLLTWSAAGNRFGSTHGIDVALLFGTEESWSDAAMLAGASWDEIEQAGSAVRALWADFRPRHRPTRPPRDPRCTHPRQTWSRPSTVNAGSRNQSKTLMSPRQQESKQSPMESTTAPRRANPAASPGLDPNPVNRSRRSLAAGDDDRSKMSAGSVSGPHGSSGSHGFSGSSEILATPSRVTKCPRVADAGDVSSRDNGSARCRQLRVEAGSGWRGRCDPPPYRSHSHP